MKEFKMSDRTYRGANPVYVEVTDPETKKITRHVKVAKGIPFRRIR